MSNKFKLCLAATLAIGSCSPVFAQTHHVKHKFLKSVAAGVVSYEAAKHSHNRFLHKHRFAAGLAGAAVAHHYMKKHEHGH
jgi:hypothetical protein